MWGHGFRKWSLQSVSYLDCDEWHHLGGRRVHTSRRRERNNYGDFSAGYDEVRNHRCFGGIRILWIQRVVSECFVFAERHFEYADFRLHRECFRNRKLQHRRHMVGNRRNDYGWRRVHTNWRGHGNRDCEICAGCDEVRHCHSRGDCSREHHHFRFRELQSGVDSVPANFYVHGQCFRNGQL